MFPRLDLPHCFLEVFGSDLELTRVPVLVAILEELLVRFALLRLPR